MPAIAQPRTKPAVTGTRLGRELRHEIGHELRRMRLDAGLSARAVARAAGISHSTLLGLEDGAFDPTVEVVSRVGSVLGCRVALRLNPGAGPAIKDHLQTAMIAGFVPILGRAWRRQHEVPVFRPIRGYVDLAIEEDLDPLAVAVEAHSVIGRVEQTLRWIHAKSDALETRLVEVGRPRPVSRVLLLRSVAATREAVTLAEDLFAAAFPARMADAVAALRDPSRGWPGPAIVWMGVRGPDARVLAYPPPGIRIGR